MKEEIRTPTPEGILNKIADSHSYTDWAEAMYDTHSHTQIEFAAEAMEEYKNLCLREAIEEIEKNSSPLLAKDYVIEILQERIK
jgi:hypothetical protein